MLAADQEQDRVEGELREVVNYLRRAEHAFAWTAEGRPLTVGLLTELHGQLVRGTPSQDR